MVEKKIGFKGKNFIKSKVTPKKFNVEKDDIDYIKENDELDRYIVDKKTGEIIVFNLKLGKLPKDTPQYVASRVYNPLILRNFGIKRITNKQLLNVNEQFREKLKTSIILNDGIVWGVPVKVIIVVFYYIFFPSSKRRHPKEENEYAKLIIRMKEKRAFENKDEFDESVIDEIIKDNPKQPALRILYEVGDCEINIHKIYALSYNRAVLNISDEGLYDSKPLKLSIFTSNIKLKEYDNCVKNVLSSYYCGKKGISKQTIDRIDDTNGVSVKAITSFCKQYNIKTIAYDINKNVIMKYVPEKKSKSYKSLIYVAYNNHIYPINNRMLTSTDEAKYTSEEYYNIKEIKSKLIKALDNEMLPDNISLNGTDIFSFIVKNKLYHTNSEYLDVVKIAKIFGIEEKIDPRINLSSIGEIIEKLYTNKSVKSFFPYDLMFNGGYNYCNQNFIDEYGNLMDVKNIITIDHCKHYSVALSNLDYLISTDIRDSKIRKINELEVEINDHFLYVVYPKKSSILMPCNDFYTGYELLYCSREGLEYEIIYEIETQKHDNYYKKLIEDLRKKLTNDMFKTVVVRLIGKLNGDFGSVSKSVFKQIANKNETKCTDGYYMPLNDEFNIVFDIEDRPSCLYNKRPIRHQILFQARKIVYEKMKELKITDKNLVKIHTDAITYVYDKKPKSETEFGKWKIEEKEEVPMNTSDYIPNEEITLDIEPLTDKNTIWIDYAGSGKTHYIINKLIPSLKDKYLVVTPSHASCKDYRQNNIDCKVIQTFSFRSTSTPEENIIIVDEIGMVNKMGWDFLIRCAMLGKTIYAFGDFKQLPPPSEKSYYSEDNKIMINMIFKNKESLDTNYRNTFTKEYYNKLIKSKDNKYLTDEIEKYSCKDHKKADIVICYRNETRKIYNELMLKHLKINKFDVGCKVVCKTNDLSEYEIYNNFYYKIMENDGEWVKLYDGIDYYDLELSDIKSNFELGYARTVYNIQGESVKSFYYASEDYRYLDGTTTYTIISRLKTK